MFYYLTYFFLISFICFLSCLFPPSILLHVFYRIYSLLISPFILSFYNFLFIKNCRHSLLHLFLFISFNFLSSPLYIVSLTHLCVSFFLLLYSPFLGSSPSFLFESPFFFICFLPVSSLFCNCIFPPGLIIIFPHFIRISYNLKPCSSHCFVNIVHYFFASPDIFDIFSFSISLTFL